MGGDSHWIAFALVLFAIGGYFLPGIIATTRRTSLRAAVWVVNVFLGWTFVGWVVALAMAVSGRVEPRIEPGQPDQRNL